LSGELYALAAALTWAVGSLLFARIGQLASPYAMNLGKCLSAGALLVGAALVFGGRPAAASAGAWAWLAASAVVGLTIGDTAYFGAIVRLGVPRAIVLLSSAPIFAAVLGAIFLHERLGVRGALGILLTLVGVALVVLRRDAGTEPNLRVGSGLALGLLGGIGQAVGSVLSKRAMDLGIEPAIAGGARLFIGGVALLIGLAAVGRARTTFAELGKSGVFGKIAGASLVGSFLGIYLAQTALHRTASVGVAATLLATSPVFAVPLAHWTGQERIRPGSVVGAITAVAGVAVLTLAR
jgi:drug/metabolite transporter (DMT)-like permease